MPRSAPASEAIARKRLQQPGMTVTPRRIWPSGMKTLGVAAAGRIAAEATAEPGRSVGRLTDLGWGGHAAQDRSPTRPRTRRFPMTCLTPSCRC